jgi:adenosine deaminase
MVAIALDGVEATWLDETEKRELRARVEREGAELGSRLNGR